MKKLIHYDPSEAGKLHCDACGYDMPTKVAWGPHLIGTPCPRCSANMLTQRDYDSTSKMFAWIDWLNKWFGWMGSDPIKDADKFKVRLRVTVHDNKMEIEHR
jgi:hypothetical protein